ncbi:Glycosyl transferase family 2 [Apibacter mensalis]|uniref:Glycosyl transferase family 2 n=1 Tax=Apibacter mensalis TaxID=1586267 RepID=A0A0X3APJ0_9FLAO|nr:glycosyltransferase [Apibacter mensalis]CVK16281.1 Glycosyl transferase family 2 [Apibacter mensalis]
MYQPLVSIIIPTYNVEKYIEQGIDSLLNQTYSNLEILIIDDCSTDNTPAILEKKYTKNKKIKIIEKSENLGPANSRNIGIQQAHGKYIALLDGDDYYAVDKIEKQVQVMESNPDVAVCSTFLYTFGLEEKEIRFPISHIEIKDQQLLGCPVAHPATMFRTSYIRENNLYYNENLRFSEDYDLFIRVLLQGGKFMTIPEALYFYRLTGNQASFTRHNNKILKNEKQWEISKALHYKVLSQLIDENSKLYHKKYIDALLVHHVIRNFQDLKLFIVWAKRLIEYNESIGCPFSSKFLESTYKKSVLGYFLAQKQLSWKILYQYVTVYPYCAKLDLTYQIKYIIKCILFLKH